MPSTHFQSSYMCCCLILIATFLLFTAQQAHPSTRLQIKPPKSCQFYYKDYADVAIQIHKENIPCAQVKLSKSTYDKITIFNQSSKAYSQFIKQNFKPNPRKITAYNVLSQFSYGWARPYEVLFNFTAFQKELSKINPAYQKNTDILYYLIYHEKTHQLQTRRQFNHLLDFAYHAKDKSLGLWEAAADVGAIILFYQKTRNSKQTQDLIDNIIKFRSNGIQLHDSLLHGNLYPLLWMKQRMKFQPRFLLSMNDIEISQQSFILSNEADRLLLLDEAQNIEKLFKQYTFDQLLGKHRNKLIQQIKTNRNNLAQAKRQSAEQFNQSLNRKGKSNYNPFARMNSYGPFERGLLAIAKIELLTDYMQQLSYSKTLFHDNKIANSVYSLLAAYQNNPDINAMIGLIEYMLASFKKDSRTTKITQALEHVLQTLNDNPQAYQLLNHSKCKEIALKISELNHTN